MNAYIREQLLSALRRLGEVNGTLRLGQLMISLTVWSKQLNQRDLYDLADFELLNCALYNLSRRPGTTSLGTPESEYRFICPACGYFMTSLIDTDSGSIRSDACFCCGYQPNSMPPLVTIEAVDWRTGWRSRGMPWISEAVGQPDGWSPTQQIARLTET
jgi:hypothetical protein